MGAVTRPVEVTRVAGASKEVTRLAAVTRAVVTKPVAKVADTRQAVAHKLVVDRTRRVPVVDTLTLLNQVRMIFEMLPKDLTLSGIYYVF